MIKEKKYLLLGMDLGGSHISGAQIIGDEMLLNKEEIIEKKLDSSADAITIIKEISEVITGLVKDTNESVFVGMAVPGPFNYLEGISTIDGVGGKYKHIFGLNVREALKTFSNLPIGSEIVFDNDAHCFGLGVVQALQIKTKNVIALTLGTGFGSSFLINGELIDRHESIPQQGAFYCEPFKDSIADEYFSTRWFIKQYQTITGKTVQSVKELAELVAKDDDALKVFDQFGFNLAEFLSPWLVKFECNTLVIGGNISRVWHLFQDGFSKGLSIGNHKTEILFSEDTESCIIKGAAVLAKNKKKVASDRDQIEKYQVYRKTLQPLQPIYKLSNGTEGYELYPTCQLEDGKVIRGFVCLAKQIALKKTVVIDGFGGVLWDKFRIHLNAAIINIGIKPLWFDISSCQKDESVINEMIKDSLNGDDPVFGKRFTGELLDFFDKDKLNLVHPDQNAALCIVYGTGAALANWDAPLIYLDVPKNEIQYRMRAKSIRNLAASTCAENTQMYKRFYFVDWPVLNKHKEMLLDKFNVVVDEQHLDDITWMTGANFRTVLDNQLQQAFRARPWFEAGIWGGNWMKKNLKGLQPNEVNYAWSFELITPENGIVFSSDNNLLEVSFDFLLFRNNQQLLGKAANRFGNEFPIRFDFLDTFDGGNLSIQCHPRTKYIQEKFGENFTQDETYYIMDCEPDAKVYIGFQDNIQPEAFKTALINSQEEGIEINAEDYVQSFPANKHDLFLIPNGTVHASGKNNLVLEISSTPYIFTFKMYDWQRLDLTGKPRPINIEHAFNNLYFDRKGAMVEETLISKTILLHEETNYKRVQLSTHPEHFYAVERFEFTGKITITTKQQCHICMLVEGESIDVKTNGKTHHFNLAETFVIPAAVAEYTVNNKFSRKAMLVIAYVKDECC